MNKLEQIKLKKNIALMKESTEQCAAFLKSYVDSVNGDFAQMPDDVVRQFNNVIKHQKNMVKFFGIMEQKL